VNDNVIYSYLVYLLMYICFGFVCFIVDIIVFFATMYYFFDEFICFEERDLMQFLV
jgi:hypothetical protein